MLVEPTDLRKAIFWKKVEIIEDIDSCWPWTGATNEKGYGIITVTVDGRQKFHYAHRVSYEWENGEIAPGLIVRHRCDNPPCVRPSHLIIGTHQDNTNDKMERGRYVSAVARITEADAVAIRIKKANGVSVADICSEYDLCPQHVNSICRGKYWPNAEGPLTTRFVISDEVVYGVLSDSERMSRDAIAIKHRISKAAVQQIITGKRKPKGPSPFLYDLLNGQ